MPHRLTSGLIALLLILAAAIPAAAQNLPQATLRDGAVINLVSQALVVEGDPAGPQGIQMPQVLRDAAEQVRLPPAPWPDYKIRWLAIELHNPAASGTAQWMLRMDTDPLYLPQMILLKDGGVVAEAHRLDARSVSTETGAVLAVGQRFPITVPPGETRVLLLRVMALGFGSLVADVVSLRHWTDWAMQRQAMTLLGLAIIAATALFTVVIGAGLRHAAYFWYGLHALSLLTFWLNVYGVPADLFGFTDHNRIVYALSSTMATALAPLLTRSLLDVPRYSRLMDRALLVIGILGFLLAAPMLLLWPWPELHRGWVRGPEWQYLLGCVSYPCMLIAALLGLRQVGRTAIWYLAGWAVYLGGTATVLSAYFGALPFSGELFFGAFLTVAWEALLLAQAVATRIRLLHDEKVAAEAQRKAQEDFVASISHDLRTPLNAILGAAAAADDRGFPDAARQRLGAIRRAGKVLLALISDLLDRASISSGNLTILKRPLPLRECINDAVELVRERAEEKGLLIRANVDTRLPEWIEADELRLKQILLNLMENAVKFTTSGEIVVTAAINATSGLEIVVSDTGPGIPSDEQDAIFAPYRRGAAAEDHRYGGSSRGLGLSIARDLSRAMGGNITVESTSGKGSQFHLVLPLVPAVAVSRNLTSRIVLLVDDVGLNREVGAALLRSEGHVVHSCAATEALEQIERETPDVILLDLQMPELDGFELARRVRSLPDERKANLPFIALTATVNTEIQQRLASLGIFEVLQKPPTAESLRSALQNAVNHDPPMVNYSLQLRLALEIGHQSWMTALQRFRDASKELMLSLAVAPPNQRMELLHRLAGMAGALGLDVVSQRAASLEQQQRNGDSVLDELVALEALWRASLDRCLTQPLKPAM